MHDETFVCTELTNVAPSSTVIAQLVYTFGGSNFAGANGSMMIEVVVSTASPPFRF